MEWDRTNRLTFISPKWAKLNKRAYERARAHTHTHQLGSTTHLKCNMHKILNLKPLALWTIIEWVRVCLCEKERERDGESVAQWKRWYSNWIITWTYVCVCVWTACEWTMFVVLISFHFHTLTRTRTQPLCVAACCIWISTIMRLCHPCEHHVVWIYLLFVDCIHTHRYMYVRYLLCFVCSVQVWRGTFTTSCRKY